MRRATLELSSLAARSIVKIVEASVPINRFERASAPAPFEALCKRATLPATPIAAAGPVAASERLPNGRHPGSRVRDSASPRGPLSQRPVEDLEAEPRSNFIWPLLVISRRNKDGPMSPSGIPDDACGPLEAPKRKRKR